MAEVREAQVYRLSLQEAVAILVEGIKARGLAVPAYDGARLDLDAPNNIIQLTVIAVQPGVEVRTGVTRIDGGNNSGRFN